MIAGYVNRSIFVFVSQSPSPAPASQRVDPGWDFYFLLLWRLVRAGLRLPGWLYQLCVLSAGEMRLGNKTLIWLRCSLEEGMHFISRSW